MNAKELTIKHNLEAVNYCYYKDSDIFIFGVFANQ